jgi:CRP-like cAMP-binding protein
VRERVAYALLEHADADGRNAPATVTLTREQIAQRIASSREAVTRALRELEATGLVGKKGAKIVVPDRARLAEHLSNATGIAFADVA